jgi:hypothetical protein
MDWNKVLNFLTAKGVAAIGIACVALAIFVYGVSYAGGSIILFLVTSVIAMYAFSLSVRIYSSESTVKDVIPPNDRPMIEAIIKNGNDEALGMYIKICSLYGFTCNITKLGLSGLPLLTVALTLLFTTLAAVLWSQPHTSDPSVKIDMIANIMDLAKLTLGAFIGSFVQRAVSERAEARPQIPPPPPPPNQLVVTPLVVPPIKP